MPLPSVFQEVQDCRLSALKRSKPLCFSGGSRLPFSRLQTLQTPPEASKATTLTATCPCHMFFRGFKTAVCPASNAPNPFAGLQGNNSYSYMPLPSVVKGVQACRLPGRLPGLKCLKRCAAASSRHSGHCPLLLSAFKPATWLNARLWPQILRSFVLHDSIDWFRCENLSRKPYKHIITSYVYIYMHSMYIRTLERGSAAPGR